MGFAHRQIKHTIHPFMEAKVNIEQDPIGTPGDDFNKDNSSFVRNLEQVHCRCSYLSHEHDNLEVK